jgi:formate-dependent phosphoribosylglycinamide formyltransferase (GAR transformylase)
MRVLLLATTTGYQTRSFSDAAERLGVQLVFATDRCQVLDDPWRDRAIPIHFHDEPASVAAIVDVARDHALDGVLAVGDRPTVIAARVCEALGLPGHPAEAAAIARNKERMRARLQAAGLPVPAFIRTDVTADAVRLARGISFPCVVKPVALSGSRGVMRADTAQELVDRFDRLRMLLQSADIQAERNDAHQTVLVEAFIPGREYAVEGVLHNGVLQVLAIFDKPDPLDGPFFEETVYITPSAASSSVQGDIERAIAQASEAIGLRHGPIHAECRVNETGVFVLEVAARPIGGLCARSLRFTSRPADAASMWCRDPGSDSRCCGPNESRLPAPEAEISLEELLLRHAVGDMPMRYTREPAAAGVMMIPIPRRGVLKRVDGVDAARGAPGIVDLTITAKTDQMLVPLPEGASYLGFIFARAATPAAVERSLRDAHARLTFRIDPEFPVLRTSRSRYNQTHG